MTIGKNGALSSWFLCIYGVCLMEMFSQDLDDDCSSHYEILHDCVLLCWNYITKCVCMYWCIIRLVVFHENWFSEMDAEHWCNRTTYITQNIQVVVNVLTAIDFFLLNYRCALYTNITNLCSEICFHNEMFSSSSVQLCKWYRCTVVGKKV